MTKPSITSQPQPPPNYFPVYSEHVPKPPMPTPYVSPDPFDNTTTTENEPPLNDTSGLYNVPLTYQGGPVLSNVQVFGVFWGDVANMNQTIGFYKAVVGSSWMDLMVEYNTSKQTIGYGTYIGTYIETDNVVRHLSTWDYLAPYLRTLIKKKIITPTPNLYVAVHLSPGIAVDQINPNIDCLDYCGFHTSMYIGNIPGVAYNYLSFGIMVDQGPTSRCMGPCGWNHNWIGNSNSLASHELAEATTDPAYPAAWYRNDVKAEIADYCNFLRSTVLGTDGVAYLITPLWSNSKMDCMNPKVNGIVATSTVMQGLGGGPLPTYSPDLNS
ncbi:hypothetical protein HDU76_008801, partial [Blyttiomyces sp. JEL0837]